MNYENCSRNGEWISPRAYLPRDGWRCWILTGSGSTAKEYSVDTCYQTGYYDNKKGCWINERRKKIRLSKKRNEHFIAWQYCPLPEGPSRDWVLSEMKRSEEIKADELKTLGWFGRFLLSITSIF